MKTVAYIRVSTEKQKDQGFSLEAQKLKIQQYADLYDLHVVEIFVETESAKSLKRPQLERALDLLTQGKAEALLVVKLDRLTRSVADLGKLLKTYFEKYSLISVSENIDTRSAAGRLVLNVLASVSQWEREAIGERTSAALQYKKQQGEYTGGMIPYGYQLDDDNTHLIPNNEEQKVIHQAKYLKGLDHSLNKIAKILARQGRLSRSRKPFSAKTIRAMVA